MTNENRTVYSCTYDFGGFEGFNFRSQSAIERILKVDDVLNWDHDAEGEAEFWPAGDCAGVAVVFRGRDSVTASELRALEALLTALGGDTDENYLRVYAALSLSGDSLADLETWTVEDEAPMIYWGSCFIDVRKEAAYDLFETCYPELYRLWESTPCDGLRFCAEDFLDSPVWSVDEVRFDERVALLIRAQ